MSDVALLRGSQAAHTQPICHGHAQGSKQPANNIMGSGHVTQTAKKYRRGPTPKKVVSRPWESPGSLPPQPRCAHPRPNHPPYPYKSRQRQRPRFHRRNGARRSPNRRFVCGPAIAGLTLNPTAGAAARVRRPDPIKQHLVTYTLGGSRAAGSGVGGFGRRLD